MEEITFEESLRLINPLYVDVRAPIEYNEDHIPGAINLPIFNDEERKEVGTLYKMAGREDAIKRGTEIGGRRISDIVNSLTLNSDRKIIIYCARGGMRSGAVASLISSLGMETYRIKDGYKAFRKFVMESLTSQKIKPGIFVLQGLTGAGKTEILKTLPNSVDLEGMAGHRSSLFGGIGLKQNTQKHFETLLWYRLEQLEDEPYVIFEGESRKVGNLHIPENIFRQMREASSIYIDTPIERRIEIIKKEYTGFNEDEKILSTVSSLRSKLGSKKTDALTEFFNKGDINEFIRLLLLDYYDLLYRHTLDKIEYLAMIYNKETSEASEKILETIRNSLAGRI